MSTNLTSLVLRPLNSSQSPANIYSFLSSIYTYYTLCCISPTRSLSMTDSFSSQAASRACNEFSMMDGCCKDVPKQQLRTCSHEPYYHASYDDQPGEDCQDLSKILGSSSLRMATEPSVQDEIVPLLGNPYFAAIMSESHIHRDFILEIPTSFLQYLPPSSTLVVLYCRNNEWVVKCCVYGHKKQLENGWERFVVDNKLRVGDGCVFELMGFKESFPLKYKVQILDGQIPSQGIADLHCENCLI